MVYIICPGISSVDLLGVGWWDGSSSHKYLLWPSHLEFWPEINFFSRCVVRNLWYLLYLDYHTCPFYTAWGWVCASCTCCLCGPFTPYPHHSAPLVWENVFKVYLYLSDSPTFRKNIEVIVFVFRSMYFPKGSKVTGVLPFSGWSHGGCSALLPNSPVSLIFVFICAAFLHSCYGHPHFRFSTDGK